MSKETESQGEWEADLLRARERLSKIRETLIFSWLKIHSADNKNERIIWGKSWGGAVREEIELTKNVIAPAKIKLGLPLTNRKQEKRVKRRARKISEIYGGKPWEGAEIARRHIKFTKNIQRRLGV